MNARRRRSVSERRARHRPSGSPSSRRRQSVSPRLSEEERGEEDRKETGGDGKSVSPSLRKAEKSGVGRRTSMFSTWETFARKRYEKGREDERKAQAKRIAELEKTARKCGA